MGYDIRREFNQNALAAICARYGVTELSVFGSAARGELRDDSDIDLLAEFDEGRSVTLFTLIDLQTELAALLGRAVDLVPKRGLKPLVRERVLTEARVLYAA
jgi:hypothetical protein